jgi:hypothetical protein
MAINNDNNDNNADANDVGPSKDQLLALYKHAFLSIKQQLDELKQAVQFKDEIIKYNQDQADEAKEQLSQMIKKDEMKTAMLKQLLKK